MVTLVLLAGIWLGPCMQTQTTNRQGFARDNYEFTGTGKYTETRLWFSDSACTKRIGLDSQSGSLKIGSLIEDGMMGVGSTEVDFTTSGGTDKGALLIVGKNLRVARGMKNSSMRNTMLGLSNFTKQ
jgi:hypothetical protein